jgi:periplasmic divalent cation tolerance protein
MHQLQALANLALLLVGVPVETLDVLFDSLNLLGFDGVALLGFLDEFLFIHPCAHAVRAGERDAGVHQHGNKRDRETPSTEHRPHPIPSLEDNINIACIEMTDKIVVLNTCGSEAEAERLARLLVDQHLAACVSIVPKLRSFYRWNGAVESAEEWLLLIKSSRPLFERLRAALEKAHSYEVPEVLALPVVDGAAGYLEWLDGSLRVQEP